MALTIAVMGQAPAIGVRGSAAWGRWMTHSWSSPVALAADPDVVATQTDSLLVLVPTAGAAAARIAASTVAAVRPDIRVRVEVVAAPLAPLVRAVELAPHTVTYANAIHEGVLDNLRRSVWGAWMPSVAGLERPTPSLGQHVASWVARRGGFLALVGEPGHVVRLPAAHVDPSWRLPRVEAAASGETYDCQVFGDFPEDAIKTLFEIGVSSRPVRREGFGDAKAAWGSAKAVDFVVSPASLASADGTRLGRPAGRCPACGEPVWASHCPFCRVAHVGRAARPTTTATTATAATAGATTVGDAA